MLKIGIRHNLVYPTTFISLLLLRRIVKLSLERFINIEGPFIFTMSMFLLEFLIGMIFILSDSKKGIKLRTQNKISNSNDSTKKIMFLLFSAAFFEFYGCVVRRYFFEEFNENVSENFHDRFRSLEIIIASILCYFTIRLRIYRHHLVSLIIIGICLLLMLIIEFIFFNDNMSVLKGFCVVFVSSVCKVYLDVIEKYLFEVNYINLFSMMIIENSFDLILSLILIFGILEQPIKEIKDLYENSSVSFVVVIILILVYAILSAIKNIYRRYTVKFYSPMTRSMAESILDPFFLIYDSFLGKNKYDLNEKLFYIIFSIILSIIMIFLSLVYNEFIIVYLCGLEHNTHLEIGKRMDNFETIAYSSFSQASLELSDETSSFSMNNSFYL